MPRLPASADASWSAPPHCFRKASPARIGAETRSDADRARYAERQRQVELAEQRGESFPIGTAVREAQDLDRCGQILKDRVRMAPQNGAALTFELV